MHFFSQVFHYEYVFTAVELHFLIIFSLATLGPMLSLECGINTRILNAHTSLA